ncbi:hypothetical protein [Dongia sp.]|uniref:hypothetical protein n=1 Tax=Dongia sp. TaxID=1977262 RepID=UPI0035B050B7
MDLHELRWSGSEKKIARQAFEAAIEAALAGIVTKFKAKAAAVVTVSDVWDIENYLRRLRREADELFDYRYSRLCSVFARLICLGHMDEGQLAGLSDDKREIILGLRDWMRER